MKTYPRVVINKKNLLQLLSKKNMAVADLSRAMNCKTSQLSNWVNGKNGISPKKRALIMQILGSDDWNLLFLEQKIDKKKR